MLEIPNHDVLHFPKIFLSLSNSEDPNEMLHSVAFH